MNVANSQKVHRNRSKLRPTLRGRVLLSQISLIIFFSFSLERKKAKILLLITACQANTAFKWNQYAIFFLANHFKFMKDEKQVIFIYKKYSL